ncbi:MAG: hypothetical protein N3A58_08590, partial [Spirochaetes bacterium]|nr:hypothetical protein [Spirochaetota bacterium]
MSLIQIFSNKLYFNKNLEIFVKTLEDNKNNLIQDNSNLFIIKKENETIYSIDFKNKLKLNNVFCYLKLNNDIKINLNIYIKGKPFNFENFYILKTFRENFAVNNIKGEISFTNNFFEFNIDSLYEIINDEKNIISKVKKDLNIFENLQIDKILKLKK